MKTAGRRFSSGKKMTYNHKTLEDTELYILRACGVPCRVESVRFKGLIHWPSTYTTALNGRAGYTTARVAYEAGTYTPEEGDVITSAAFDSARVVLHDGALVHAYGSTNKLRAVYVRIF